jgi:hypothetical protein
MGERLKYVKRPDQAICAVQLNLETDGFTYRKWGGQQRCKAGDWLIDNDGDVYSVDRESFERTYRRQPSGKFLKIAPVWAEVATEAGSVKTKEGATRYEPGDYLVSNETDGGDAYAVTKEKFEAMYQRADAASGGTAWQAAERRSLK